MHFPTFCFSSTAQTGMDYLPCAGILIVPIVFQQSFSGKKTQINRKFEHYIRVLNVALEHEVGDQGKMIFEMNLKEWLGDKNVASGEHWGPCKGMED